MKGKAIVPSRAYMAASSLLRRQLLLAAALPCTLRQPASAAQGAFEMDAEFYVRGLLGQPTAPAVRSAMPAIAPRRLDARFVEESLAAVEDSLAHSLSTTITELREKAEERTRRGGVRAEYEKALTQGAFGGLEGYFAEAASNAPSRSSPDAANQFNYDLTLLTFFTLLADAKVPTAEIEACRQRLGASLLAGVAGAPTRKLYAPTTLTALTRGMRALLDGLKDVGYIAGYGFDDADVDEGLWAQASALSATRLTITLDESASLRSGLVLNGRGGASSELARPLLSAWLAEQGARVVEATEYFVDSTYKTNPLEYRPDQQVLMVTIKPYSE